MQLATAALALVTLVPSGTIGGASETTPPSAPDISIHALLPSWRQRVQWAVDRFAMAGLPLPSLDITVHRHTTPCEGNSGLYRHGPPAEVHVCSTGDADTRAARMISLHELAHAWAEAFLTAAQREQFLELRGLDSWIDPDRGADEWGAEHAAEVVSWGLTDAPVEIIRIADTDRAALEAAFELLVGRSPMWADPAREP